MKRYTILGFCFVMAVLQASAVFGQGFTGPAAPGTASAQAQTVTVAQAKNMPDKSLVTLTGTIVQSTGKEKYTFRDSSGDITVDIDRKVWAFSGLTVGVNDTIEITGKLEKEWFSTKVEVKAIRKV